MNFYEGKSPVTRDNLYLGQVVLKIAAAPRGMPKIRVTIEVQYVGRLCVGDGGRRDIIQQGRTGHLDYKLI